MDTKKSIENLFSAVKVIRSNQKGQTVKLLELDAKINAFADIEIRLDKLEEQAWAKEKDEEINEVNERVEGIGNVVDAHIDSITELEETKMDILNRLGVIDDTIAKITEEIKTIEYIKAAKEEEIKLKAESHIKVCRFNNLGYCKIEKNLCNFYHSEEICEIYEEKGICYRMLCRKRHPRQCKYDKEGNCYRGNGCMFKHMKGVPIDKTKINDTENLDDAQEDMKEIFDTLDLPPTEVQLAVSS